MGLDNGIIIKKSSASTGVKWIFEHLLKLDITHYDDEEYYDICYWRKCSNIRNKIINNIGSPMSEGTSPPLHKRNLCLIIKMLFKFNKHNWYEDGGSIWSFREFRHHLVTDIVKLTVTVLLMFVCEFDVFFYDSY